MKKLAATLRERPFPLRIAGVLTCFFTALLPLKFGIMFFAGEPGAFPEGGWGWGLNPWTMPLFTTGAGIVLAAVLAGSWNLPWWMDRRQPLLQTAFLWLLLPIVGLVGLIRASSPGPGILQLTEFCGIAAYAFAMMRLLAVAPEYRKRLLAALTVGLGVTAAAGWHQYWFGFDEMRKFIIEQETAGKLRISDDLRARIWDTRVAATFTFAGSLAGCLLTAAPAAVVLLWQCGRKLDPPRLSAWVLAGAGCIVFGGVFAATRGRSAFLAAILAAALCLWIRLPRRRDRIVLALAALAVIAGGALYVHFAGRGFSSLAERISYWKSSARIVLKEPWCGTGWGDFVHRHALYKDMGNHELAKDPHNIIASFAVGTGISGLLLALKLLLVPWWLALRKLRRNGWTNGVETATFFGLTGFIFYSQADPVLQVPALMGICALLQGLLLAPENAPAAGDSCGIRWKRGILAAAAAASLALGLWQTAADRALENLQRCSGCTVGAVSSGTPQEIAAALQRAAALRPHDASPWLCAGRAAMRRQDYRLAERMFLEAERRSPESWSIPLALAEARLGQGRNAEAKRDYEEARRRFPHNDRLPKLDFGSAAKPGKE